MRISAKGFIYLFLTIVISLILQICLKQYIPVFGTAPDIMFITVIYFGFRYGCMFGQVYGFVAGLFLDMFSLSLFGLNSFCFTLLGYLAGFLNKKFDETQPLVQVSTVFFASCFYIFFIFLIHTITVVPKTFYIGKVFFIPLYNSVVSYLIFKLFSKIWK